MENFKTTNGSNGIDIAINKNPIRGRWQILSSKPKVICDTYSMMVLKMF